MNIISIRKSTSLSDGRVRREYLLSSPVTGEVLNALSHGDHIYTGYQYLSPTYSVIKGGEIEISGILKSPVIQIACMPGMVAACEDYLSGFLSTIPDSEKPGPILTQIRNMLITNPCVERIKQMYHKEPAYD